MHKARSVIGGLFVTTLFLGTSGYLAASGLGDGTEPPSQTMGTPKVQVTLSAAHRTTSWDDRVPERPKFDLLLLYLHREREGADEADRTLAIHIAGLAGGDEIEIEVVSHHENAYTAEPHAQTKSLVLPDRPCTAEDPCTLQWTFDPANTPSDLYHLHVKDASGKALWSSPYADRPDFAMLDTWDLEVGAYTVRVYYATLFPFARDPDRIDYRLPPEAVPSYIEHQFVPMISDTWHTQFETWGFGDSIHADWDADNIVEVIITYPPFALFDGTGTHTIFVDPERRPYPERRIWWLSTHASFQRYDSWENAHRAIFAHEFFHLVQWNVLLHTGQPTSYWLNTFIEAQAKFAIGVQYPELEIGEGHAVAGGSAYGRSANRFLAHRLNASYQELEADPTSKYDLALYWRFLFEQYHHMEIIRAALEEMVYHYEPDIVGAMPSAMNAVFARFDGPFHSFEESLAAFARANYALCLENGGCALGDLAECGGYYYDPNELYVDPPLEAELDYDGSLLAYGGSVPNSFGMDFVEVSLDPTVNNQPAVITFQGEGTVAQFNVQIWKLGPGGARPRAVTLHPEIIPQNSGKAHVYVIPHLDITTYNRLAIIITRLDADETADPVGNYHITLESATDTGGDGASA